MTPSSAGRNPVEQLAEEFAERYRRGERPSLADYVERYPAYADEIRQLFPALVVLEHLKPATDDAACTSPPVEYLGDYHILREVGRGGMGVVYEAEQLSLGRHVALKVLPGHALLDPTHLERFRREARAAAKLHHTNIVPVFGVGECDGVHYYAMQFIRGEGLDRVLHDLRCLLRAGSTEPSPVPTVAENSIAHNLLSGCFAEAAVPETTGMDAPPTPPTSSTLSEAVSEGGILPQCRPDRPAGRRGAGLRAPQRRAVPRRQAVELAAGPAGDGVGNRLRPGQGRGRRRMDPDGRHRRHHSLHGPGAFRGPLAAAERRLQPGRNPVRIADAPAALRGRQQGPPGREGAARAFWFAGVGSSGTSGTWPALPRRSSSS